MNIKYCIVENEVANTNYKYFHVRYKITQKDMELIKQIEGIEKVQKISIYSIRVQKGLAFSWHEVESNIITILNTTTQ